MAISGSNGLLELGRRQPDPVIIPTEALQAGNDRFVVETDDYWPMDPVTLVHSGTAITGYYHKNELDRARLYSTPAGALNGLDADVVDLNAVTGPIILAYSPTSAQIEILEDLLAILPDPVPAEQRLRAYPSQEAAFIAQAPALVMRSQGTMRSWQFTTSAPEIDTTALGDQFSDAIKSTASGSGTCDFLVDLYYDSTKQDSDPLLRGVLLTQVGARAKAKFYLRKPQEEPPVTCSNSDKTLLTRGLWYEADILFTQTEIDTSPENFIVGSASFITVGRVALRT